MEQMKRTIKNWFVISFEFNLPGKAIQYLPTGQMYSAGLIMHAITLSGFLLFFFGGYHANRNNTYLSPSSGGGDCWNVTKPLSGTFMADDNGMWEGAANFAYSLAPYSITFNNLDVDSETYFYLLESFRQELIAIGEVAETQNLAGNILFWMTFTSNYNDTVNIQSGAMVGDPLVIFDRVYQHGAIGNRYADCNSISFLRFDKGLGYFYLSYSYSQFMNNENCSSTLDPVTIGYNPNFDNDLFSISFDIHSVNMALAINLRMQRTASIVDEDVSYVIYNETSYQILKMYDPRYPGMKPILCAVRPEQDNGEKMDFCVVELNNDVFGLPLLNHYGSNSSFPDYCSCENTTDNAGNAIPANGYTAECNEFNFFSGFLFFNGNDSITPLFELFHKYDNGNELNELAYPAMYAGASIAETDKYQNSTFRKKAFEFCETSFGGCSVVTVNSYDTLSKGVSEYYYALANGSCRDSFSGTDEEWFKLSTTTPASITEPYFECRDTRINSVIQAAGIATGFTAFLVPFMVAFAVLGATWYRISHGVYQIQHDNEYKYESSDCVHIPSTTSSHLSDDNEVSSASAVTLDEKTMIYTRFSRENVLESLSFQLLLMRDQRLSSISPVNSRSESVLYTLMEELRSNASNALNSINITAEYSGVHHFSTVLHAKPATPLSIFVPSRPSADSNETYSRKVFTDVTVPRAMGMITPGRSREEVQAVGDLKLSHISSPVVSILVLNCERCMNALLRGEGGGGLSCEHQLTYGIPSTICPKISPSNMEAVCVWVDSVKSKLQLHVSCDEGDRNDDWDEDEVSWNILPILDICIMLKQLEHMPLLESVLLSCNNSNSGSRQLNTVSNALKELLIAHCRVVYASQGAITDKEICEMYGTKVGYLIGSTVHSLQSLAYTTLRDKSGM